MLGDLIMPKGRQREKIRVDAPLEPDFVFKNQAGKGTPKAGKPPDICLPSLYRQAPGRHKATYRTRGARRQKIRWYIREPLAGRWLWVAAWFYLPQAKMLEDLLDDLLVLYETYHAHGTRALRTYKRIHLPGSSPGQAVIFCIRRAQLFLNSF